MKEKKVSKIGIIITVLVAFFFISVYFFESNIYEEKTAYCKSNGYETYKDLSALSDYFRCAKKVSDGVGYEWEYSGIVKYPIG